MKIIEQGKLPEPEKPWWPGVECRCDDCGCRFELEEGDLSAADAALKTPRVMCPTSGCDCLVVVPLPGVIQLQRAQQLGQGIRKRLGACGGPLFTGPTTQLKPGLPNPKHRVTC